MMWPGLGSDTVRSTRRCRDCEVGWSGMKPCWSCGRQGESGDVLAQPGPPRTPIAPTSYGLVMPDPT